MWELSKVVESLKAHNRHRNRRRSPLVVSLSDRLKLELRVIVVGVRQLRIHEVKLYKKKLMYNAIFFVKIG